MNKEIQEVLDGKRQWCVVQGDCLEIMPTIPDKCVDLVLTDPPFFVPAAHYQSRVKWQKKYSDLSPLKVFWEQVISKCSRVVKSTASLLTFCNHDSYPVFYEPTYNKFDKLKSLIWNKGHVGLGRCFRNQHEMIIWARFQESKIIDDGKLRADVLNFPATRSSDRGHPVEKPCAMLQHLMEPLTDKNDIILDPFLGSGTTIVAAQRLGRRAIGIELDGEYCELARKRIENDMPLFTR